MKKNRKVKTLIVLTMLEILFSVWLASVFHQIMYWITHITSKTVVPQMDLNYLQAVKMLLEKPENQLWFLLLQIAYIGLTVFVLLMPTAAIAKTSVLQITDKIQIPVAAGNGQYGSERFTTEKEKDQIFSVFTPQKDHPPQKPGVVVEMTKSGSVEKIRYVSGPVSSIIIGSTRSGKTRRTLFQTFWLQVLAGYCVVASDVKGEIYYYTHEWVEEMGHKTFALDFRNPKKSIHYNFLQQVLDALKEGDQAQAIDYTWDLVSVLVGEPKGEPLWHNGESATIAAAVLAVCIEATSTQHRKQVEEIVLKYFEITEGKYLDDDTLIEIEDEAPDEYKRLKQEMWEMTADLLCEYGTSYIERLMDFGESALIEDIQELLEKDNSTYKNLTNVYYFLAYMGREDSETGKTPLSLYLDTLPDMHPAKVVFMQGQIAAERTRSSFYTSALGTLKLFVNPNIAEMTSYSDFKLSDVGSQKAVVYMIVPDDKKTFYPLVSIFIQQIYAEQVRTANKHGGRLPVPCDYDLDEVGNFPTIPVLSSMITAGQSRGVRVNLLVQNYQQIEEKYKDSYDTIKSNCTNKIYLKTDSEKTLKEISGYLGKYTVEMTSASNSANIKKTYDGSVSSSSNLGGRELLMPAEISHISTPYALVMNQGNYSSITNLPDLSQYELNTIWGLGDEEHNTMLISQREAERPERKNVKSIPLWGIWNDFKRKLEEEAARGAAISFLGE